MLVCSNLSFSSATFSVMQDHVKWTRNVRIRIYIQVFLGMVIVINMYCWTVTLREEHSLRGFENWVLREGKRGRKEWVTGESCTVTGCVICSDQVVVWWWRELYSEGLCGLYWSSGFVVMERVVQWGAVWFVLMKWFCGDGESCTVRGCMVCTDEVVLLWWRELYSEGLYGFYWSSGFVLMERVVQWGAVWFVLIKWFCADGVSCTVPTNNNQFVMK
jgi:hypothetical protein